MAAKSKFGALAEFRQAQAQPQSQPEETAATALETPVPTSLPPSPVVEAPKSKGRPTGKRSNPDYEPTTVLLRKQTKKKASRLLEDMESDYDLSDLIEKLLGEWISGNT